MASDRQVLQCVRRASVICSLICAGLVVLAQAPARAQSSEPFKLGLLFPITGLSPATAFGSLAGVKVALAEISVTILGRHVDTVLVDDQFDTTLSVTMAKRLISVEKASAIIGPMAGQLTVAVAPVMTEGNVAY